MKNVIVTGGNGFIGSSLIKKLIEKGTRVVAVDITFHGNRLPDSNLITRIESGVNTSLVERLPVIEYDSFYHFAWKGVNGADKADPTVQLSNIQMAVDCANICKRLNVKKFLCAGTVAENVAFSLSHLKKTTGGMMYGVAKHACRIILEDYCKNIAQQFVWMQFSNIYGVGNKTGNLVSYTLGELMAGKEAAFGPALQPYDFIYVDDLIEAVYRLGFKETNKPFYYIGSGNPKVLKDYLIRIGELVGCADKVGIGVREDDGVKYTMDMFDNSNLVSTIGEYASIDFDKGINKTINWLKNSLKFLSPIKQIPVESFFVAVANAMHFQLVKQQAKLVRCISGHVYDVIIDLRPDSPTFGKWQGFDLTGENQKALYIPQYFGHGYLVLEDSVVSYKCGEVFYGEGDAGIMYNDPDMAIEWPFDKIGGIEKLIISDKDKNLMSLKEYIEKVQ